MMKRTILTIAFIFLSIVVANFYLIHCRVSVTHVHNSSLSFFLHQLEYYKKDGINHQSSDIPNVTTSSAFDVKDNTNEINENIKENENWELTSDTLSKADEDSLADGVIDSQISFFESSSYNATEYQLKLDEVLKPDRDKVSASSSSWIFFKFWAGLCNQYMMFIGAILLAIQEGRNQILEESIQWKDTYGNDNYLQHKKLFDVVHWNSFYPHLPRIVQYEKELHPDIKVRNSQEKIEGEIYSKAAFLQVNVTGDPFEEAKNPTPLGQNLRQTMNQYRMLARRVDENALSKANVPSKQDIGFELIMKSAFRPHPEIQSFIDHFVKDMKKVQQSKDGEEVCDGFMVIHARVEPDMQNHPVCKDKKVKNVTDIIESIYSQYPEPPVSWVVMIFNRELVEALVTGEKTDVMRANKELTKSFQDQSIQELTAYNLKVINDCLENGLWNGRVRVKEAGSKYVEKISKDPWYRHYSNIVGGVLNFFMAIQSDIFVGTEVSSYSTLVANSRFYREKRSNYFYRPDGLYWVTPPNATKPHRFVC